MTRGVQPVHRARRAAALTDADIEQILDQVPATAARPRMISRLGGGLTNVNVKVTTASGAVVARIATTDSDLLEIDREAEHANSMTAAGVGAGPRIVDYSPSAGVLVVAWQPGRTLSAADLDQPATLSRVAQACRRLHAGPRFAADFDMFTVQRHYLDVVVRNGFRLPPRYLEFIGPVQSIRQALSVRVEPSVPCHNDLLAENIIDDGTRAWLIDYEYAGNNDPCFELGNIWSEACLPPDRLVDLITLYYGLPLVDKIARARLLGLMSKYGWTLWGVIQSEASSLDVDFRSWAMDKYERAVAEFTGPDFDRLLGQAAGSG